MVRAWLYNADPTIHPQQPHQYTPNRTVALETLALLGVDYWYIPECISTAISNPDVGKLGQIRQERHYQSHDYVQVTPTKLPNYETKIKQFFEEHLHEDEEIRYCLDGTGYFDVRSDLTQEWIRIEVAKGDMIVLPAGIYHRYTNDTNDYVHMMRLFKENPKWEAINRGDKADITQSRKDYLKNIYDRANEKYNGANVTTHGTEDEMNENNATNNSTTTTKVHTSTNVNGEAFILQQNAQALANYPHMRAYNGLLYVSGISSRLPTSPPSWEGVKLNPKTGKFDLNIKEQTAAVLKNIQTILAGAGANLSHVVDLTTFLVNMNDYDGYNEVYNQFFPKGSDGPSRTTVAVHQLPHPNLLIEIKCIAVDPRVKTNSS